MTQKIVINACFGGFGLSEAGIRRYLEIKGIPFLVEHGGKLESLCGPEFFLVPTESRQPVKEGEDWYAMSMEDRATYNQVASQERFYDRDLKRDDPILVRVVEEMPEEASGRFARLKVIEIPDGVNWEIDEYDGNESVEEVHQSWS